jgi:arylsulfatase A-like enzyme
MVGTTGDPNRQGFDLFFGYNCQRHAHSYYPSYLWHNDKRIKLDNKPPVPGHARLAKEDDPNAAASYAKFKGSDYTPDRMIEAALGFIRENKQKPFFLYYPTPLPHLALHVPDEELKPYLGKWKETPFTGGGYTPHQTPRAAYAAMITRMDTEVGRIVKLLDELKLADNTLVIFTSDNGTTHLGKEADYTFFNSVGSLRGLKGSVYEGGLRVPLVARWPGHIKPGSLSEHACAFWNMLPTLCDVAGVKPPSNIDGVSILPSLTGQGTQQKQEYLYWEFPSYGGQQAVRLVDWKGGDWKGVRTKMSKGNRKIQLFNLADDIGEKNDVAKEHPDIVKKITKIMKTARTPASVAGWNQYLQPPPARKQKPGNR